MRKKTVRFSLSNRNLPDGAFAVLSDAIGRLLSARGCALSERKDALRIVFATDRKTMWFEVDGVKGDAKPYSDYFWNQRYGTLGAIHPTMDFFDGEIRSFKVEPL